MKKLDITKKVNIFEAQLGNPNNAKNIINFKLSVSHDENSSFPKNEAAYLDDLKINWLFIPKIEGGHLSTFEELVLKFRSIYRRDPALALGYGFTTFMAAIHIWIFGAFEQKQQAARIIKSGAAIAVAYHEKDNGNDLMSTAVAGKNSEDNILLSGTKWIINNAIESKAVTAFIKTNSYNNSRDFSLFFFKKSKVNKDKIDYSRKIKTLGVRACRISGFSLKDYPLSTQNVIKGIGQGVDQTFKGFQITRAILPGMSLGAADTFLRKTYKNFAKKKTLLPIEKEYITNNFLNLIVCDVTSITAARSIHVIPKQLSIISAVTKYFVPKYILMELKNLTEIFSCNLLIREGKNALFQKILRDYPVVSFGHSSDVVCLTVLLHQIKQLMTGDKLTENYMESFINIFDLNKALPEINFDNLKFSNSGYLDILNSVISITENIILMKKLNVNTLSKIRKRVMQQQNLIKLSLDTLSINTENFSKHTYSMMDLYTRCYALLCCIYYFSMNTTHLNKYIAIDELLLAIADYLLRDEDKNINQAREKLFIILKKLSQKNIAFSVLPITYC